MSFTEYARVLHVTESIREQVFQRILGRPQDSRFDPVLDTLLDLQDALEADTGPPPPPRPVEPTYREGGFGVYGLPKGAA